MDEINMMKDEFILTDMDIKSVKITANDTDGIKSALLSVMGDYETIVTDYTYNNGNYTQHSIDIQPDYAWLAACLAFLVCLYSLMRIVGKAVERK